VPGAPIVRAFHAGLEDVPPQVDVVVKLDADVSFDADHFERLLQAFGADPQLGIAGSLCWELDGAQWQPVAVAGDHVRGAVRAYRTDLLQQIVPLPERTGWDTVDEFQAAARGWSVRTVPDLRFDHHRLVGARDGAPTRRWIAKGDAAHFLGYRPLYLLARTLFQARRDPSALAMIWGYARAAALRRERHPDRAAIMLLRREQRLRHLGNRAGEMRARTRV